MEGKIKGLAAFIAVLLLSDLAVGIAQFSFAGIRWLIGKETSLAKTPLSLQYVAITAQIVFIYLFYKNRKLDLKSELNSENVSRGSLLITVLLGASILIMNISIVYFIQALGLFASSFEQAQEVTSFLNRSNYLFWFILAVILSPIVEELLFRGAAYNVLSKYMNIKTVILLQGIVFGIFHGNLLQGILAAVIGIILGYLRFKTNSLIPAITLHISNNLFSEVINLYTENINNNTLVYAILLVIGIVGVIGFIKLFNNKQNLIIA